MSTSSTTSTGSVVTSGSTTYVSSTASGLDTNSLVTAAVAARTARADTIDAKVTANQSKITAYQTLQGLVNAISTALTPLAAPAYSATATTNAFDAKQVGLTSSDGTDTANLMAVSADADAQAGSYDMTVTQLAKAMKVTADATVSDTALGYTGAFTLGTSAGGSATISVTSDMTLQDIVDAMNAAKGETGVNATLIKVSDSSYRMVLSGAETNQTITATTSSGTDILAALGLTDSSGAFANIAQAAQPAIVTLDGATVTRDTNELDDVIPGVSISLVGTTASGSSVTLQVAPNYDGVKTAVTSFITAYNALRSFLTTQQTVGADGSISSDAVLFADSLLRGMSQSLSGLMNTKTSANGGDITHVSDLGVTFASDNSLTLSSESTLDSAILSNISDLEGFFETSFTPSDSALKLLKNSSTRSLDFTLDVTADSDGNLTGATVGGQSGLFTVSGNRIVGVDGTAYEGLSFALVATGDTSIKVKLTQGFANAVGALMTGYGDTSSGLIQNQVASLTSQDDDLDTQSSKIRSDAETYRQTLINKYAKMENEVSAAKLLQQQIASILGSSSSSAS